MKNCWEAYCVEEINFQNCDMKIWSVKGAESKMKCETQNRIIWIILVKPSNLNLEVGMAVMKLKIPKFENKYIWNHLIHGCGREGRALNDRNEIPV